MLGKIEGKRRGWQQMRQLDSITRRKFEQTQGESLRGKPGVLQFIGSQRSGHNLETEQQ